MPNTQTSLVRSSGSFPLVSAGCRRKHQSLRERNIMTSSRGLVIWKCLCRVPLSPWKHALSLRVSGQEDLLSSQTNLNLLFTTNTRGSCWTNLFDSSRWKLSCLLLVPLHKQQKLGFSQFCPITNVCLHNLTFTCQKACFQTFKIFIQMFSQHHLWRLRTPLSKMGKALRTKTV